jgi:hypothetical protein
VQESQRHAHVGELREVLLNLLVKEHADKQQAQADDSKQTHPSLKLVPDSFMSVS